MNKVKSNNKVFLYVIYLISVLIPVIVVFLILSPVKLSPLALWIKTLPSIHAMINSITVLTLGGALVAIRKKNIMLHRTLMSISLFLGVLFLISYVLYHFSVESVIYGDLDHDGVLSTAELDKAGTIRTFYLFILASHILLSILVVPFVLFSFYYALTEQIGRHKKMVKYAYPVWMYVSITGVVVYFLIKPYYYL